MISRILTAFAFLLAATHMAASAELTVPTKAHRYVGQSNSKNPPDQRSKSTTIERGSKDGNSSAT